MIGNEEEVQTEVLYAIFTDILDKLCRDNFNAVSEKVKRLNINTRQRLEGVSRLIFEKSVEVPDPAVYAALCLRISMLKVPADTSEGQYVNFRALIISACQKEFIQWTDFETKRKNRETADKEINPILPAVSPVSCEPDELACTLEEEEKRMKRSLGNVRFIAELYKLKMLTVKIMVHCVNALFDGTDNSLECLCEMLSVPGFGERLQTEAPVDNIFCKIQQIADRKMKTDSSERIYSLLLEVIELRRMKWVPKVDRNQRSSCSKDQKQKDKMLAIKMSKNYKALNVDENKINRPIPIFTSWRKYRKPKGEGDKTQNNAPTMVDKKREHQCPSTIVDKRKNNPPTTSFGDKINIPPSTLFGDKINNPPTTSFGDKIHIPPTTLFGDKINNPPTTSFGDNIKNSPTTLLGNKINNPPTTLFGDKINNPPTTLFGDKINNPPTTLFGDKINNPPTTLFGDKINNPPTTLFGDKINNPPTTLFGDKINNPPTTLFGDKINNPPTTLFGDKINNPPTTLFGDKINNPPTTLFGDKINNPPTTLFGDKINNPPTTLFGDKINNPPTTLFGDKINNPPTTLFGDKINNKPLLNENREDDFMRLAMTAIVGETDKFLKLANMMPLPGDSKVYNCLNEIRRLALQHSQLAKETVDIGVQVDFNQDPETITGEADVADKYEIINVPSEQHSYTVNTETTRDNVQTANKVMETEQCKDNSAKPLQCEAVYELQPSESGVSNVDSENDVRQTSDIALTLDNDDFSESEDIIFNTFTNSTSQRDTTSTIGSILDLVKPRNYKPKPRDAVTVKGNWEDVKTLLEKASEYIVEQNYVKAKRLADKAERIYQTPAAKALLEQIRIITEAREEAAEPAKERSTKRLAQKAIDEEIAAKATAEKAKREAVSNVSFHQYSTSKIDIEEGQEADGDSENARNPSGAESLKRNTDPEQLSPDAGKKRRADGLISVAQGAFSKGDIATAEKLAKKASKLNPSKETDKFLEMICNKTSQIEAEKKENADPNVIKNTSNNQSESDGPSQKMTSFLNKVEECLALRSSENAYNMSYPAVVRHSNPDGRNSPEEVNYPRAEDNAKRLVGIARNALAAGVENADKFLTKANAEYPCETAEQLLHDVQIVSDTSSRHNEIFSENKKKAEEFYKQAIVGLPNVNLRGAMDSAVDKQNFSKLLKADDLKTLDGNTNESEDLNKIDKALDLILQAKAEMGYKNMRKAERLLVQSIEIHSTKSAKILLKQVREFEPKHDPRLMVNGLNGNEAQKCIKVAEAAAKDKDFKRAEHLLEKALRMSPSTEAKEMLESVRVYLHEDLKHDVEKCIEVAMNAISAVDYDKATKFLKKAQRIQPSEKAFELLEDVQEGIKQQKIRMANEEKAVPFVSLAMTAIDREQYEFAEILLVNAWIKHKSGTAEKLIKQVREIVAQANSENAGKGTKKNKDSTLLLDEQRRISEELISYARDMMTKKHLESAECVLMIAQNTYPTKSAGEMLTGVRYQIDFDPSDDNPRFNTKNWKFTKISQGNKKKDAFKCNNYVQMAQRAYETGDFNAAKEFLLEAENIFPHKDIKKLINEVEAAKKLDSYFSK